MYTRISGGTPTLFGVSLFRVSSGSMEPELKIGDVILTGACDGKDVKTGDIVTYLGTSGSMSGKMVTHRVVKAPYTEQGNSYVVTKGDSNPYEDKPILTDRIQSKLITKVSILTFVYNVFITPWGLLILIGLIIFAFFNEILILIRAILGIGYEEETDENVEKIIERYQKENQALRNDNEDKTEE